MKLVLKRSVHMVVEVEVAKVGAAATAGNLIKR
jgi:hypothetical protein